MKTTEYKVYITVKGKKEYLSSASNIITLPIGMDRVGKQSITVKGTRDNRMLKLREMIGETALMNLARIHGNISFQTITQYKTALTTFATKELQQQQRTELNNGVNNTIKSIRLLKKVHTTLLAKKEESLRKKKKEVFTLCDTLNVNGVSRKVFFLSIVTSVETLSTYKVPANIVKFVKDIK